MSGLEAVGVVLRVLPILMSASKVTIRMIGVTTAMQKFHDDFFWEAFVIHRNLRRFTDSLPLTVGVKMQLKVASITALWESDEAVRKAIIDRLGENGCEDFVMISRKVLSALDCLVKNHESLRNALVVVCYMPGYVMQLRIKLT